jgi:Zn-dependent protease
MLGIPLPQLIALVIVLVVAFTVHEFSHAWIAYRLGDDTPRINGRLTLNPLAHLDPIGSLLLLFGGFGWAKPVPVNPYALNRSTPLGLMWVSLAGPLSNFLMAALAAIPLRFGLIPFALSASGAFPTAYELIDYFIYINLGLMLFNLLPIAPLDGSKIAVAVLPESWAGVVERISTFGPVILLAVVFVGPYLGINLLDWIISPVANNLYDLLTGV